MASLLQELRWTVRRHRSHVWVSLALLVSAALVAASAAQLSGLRLYTSTGYSPFAADDRAVVVLKLSPNGLTGPLDYREFDLMRHSARSFSYLGAARFFAATVVDDEGPHAMQMAAITDGWLQSLGVQPVIGRTLLPDDLLPGAVPVGFITERTWRGVFHGDTSIVGRRVSLRHFRSEDTDVRIVGVLPDSVSLNYLQPVQFLVPAMPYDPNDGAWVYRLIGRLAPGVSLAQASSEVGPLFRRIDRWGYEVSGRVEPLAEVEFQGQRRLLSLVTLAGMATCLVALIAALQLTMALVFRQSEHRRLHRLQGASRGWLLVREGIDQIVLAVCALTLVPVLANALMLPLRLGGPTALTVSVSLWDAVAAMVALSVIGWLVRGAVVVNTDDAARQNAPVRSRPVARHALFAVQVASLVTICVCGAAIVRGGISVAAAPRGFNADGVVAVRIDWPRTVIKTEGAYNMHLAQVLSDAARAVGPDHVALSVRLPLARGRSAFYLATGERAWFTERHVSNNYFRLMGIQLRSGRVLRRDDSNTDIVVNEEFVRRFLPGQDPVGMVLSGEIDTSNLPAHLFVLPQPDHRIVGVVSNTWEGSPDLTPDAVVYRNIESGYESSLSVWLLGRGRLGADTAAQLTTAVQRLGPDYPVTVVDVAAHVRQSTALTAALARWFLVIGLVLTCLLMACVTALVRNLVEMQRRSIAIRLVLGGTRWHALRPVALPSLVATVCGVVAGAAWGTWLATQIEWTYVGVQPPTLAQAMLLSAVMSLLVVAPVVAAAINCTRGNLARDLVTGER